MSFPFPTAPSFQKPALTLFACNGDPHGLCKFGKSYANPLVNARRESSKCFLSKLSINEIAECTSFNNSPIPSFLRNLSTALPGRIQWYRWKKKTCLIEQILEGLESFVIQCYQVGKPLCRNLCQINTGFFTKNTFNLCGQML